MTAYVDSADFNRATAMYAELTGRTALPSTLTPFQQIDDFLGGGLTQWRVLKPRARLDTGISYHRDGRWTAAEIKEQVELLFASEGFVAVASGDRFFSLVQRPRYGVGSRENALRTQSRQGRLTAPCR
jgi:hypothetical protein